jgi:hypothetical protein
MWQKEDRRYKKHKRSLEKIDKLKKEKRPFIALGQSKEIHSDSLDIVNALSDVYWEEHTGLLMISVYETFIQEDSQQWEQVGKSKSGHAPLTGFYQFKKVPYKDFRLVTQIEGCAESFYPSENGCFQRITSAQKYKQIKNTDGKVLIIRKIKALD